MGQTLTLNIPEEIYEPLVKAAQQTGSTPEDLAVQWLAQAAPKTRPQLSEEESTAAWERLRRYAGAATSGDPASAENDRIDADLAREYGSTHEEGG